VFQGQALGLALKHLTRLEKPARNKQFSFLGRFISYEENKYCEYHFLKVAAFKKNIFLVEMQE